LAEGAEQNINELLSALLVSYHRRRQATIDEELFDLIAGYEALRSQGLHTAMRASAGLSPPRSRCRCAATSSSSSDRGDFLRTEARSFTTN
jgi:hypothetical protein